LSESDSSVSKDSLKAEYLKMKAFLESYPLTALEAQIIIEVCCSSNYYIDTYKLLKKLPKSFRITKAELEDVLKKLIQMGYLSPYESKKDELCVRSAPFGRDFFRQTKIEGFASFENFPLLKEKFRHVKLMCYDPAGFRKGEIRYASGPDGRKIKIQIVDISPSDEVWDTTADGKTIYTIKLTAKVECPICSNFIEIESSYNPNTCYTSFNEFRCAKCGFKFMIRCALDCYYS